MRPAVYASVVRNRKQNARRIRLRAPTFSIRRLMVMVFVGGAIFIPGLALTILGVENGDDAIKYSPAHKVLYKVLGPCACATGVCVLFGGLLYYFCYGLANTTRSRHPSSASSGSHYGHSHSAYSSVRSTHGHSDHEPNGDAKGNSRQHHKRTSSGSSSGHHHHHHHSQHSHSSHTHSPMQHSRHSQVSQRQPTPEKETVPARQTEPEDVTVTLETEEQEMSPEPQAEQHSDEKC